MRTVYDTLLCFLIIYPLEVYEGLIFNDYSFDPELKVTEEWYRCISLPFGRWAEELHKGIKTWMRRLFGVTSFIHSYSYERDSLVSFHWGLFIEKKSLERFVLQLVLEAWRGYSQVQVLGMLDYFLLSDLLDIWE